MKTTLLQLLLCLLVAYLPSQAGEVYDWGPWSTWTSCSVPCDKGIMTRERRCLKQSSTSSTAGRSFERKGCGGSVVDYQFCYPRECNEGDARPLRRKVTYQDSYRIRAEQCAAFNKRTYNGKKINWKPYMKEYLNLCKLYCLASGHKFYAQLGQQVRDGTPCGKDQSNVCIQGKCQERPSGCRSLDGPCIVEKRRKVIGVFNSTDLIIGYNFVATIPKGATDVIIEELTNSRSYLALRDHDSKNYTLNGHWRISLSKTFQSTGTKIYYTRNGNTERGGEIIKADGPLARSLDVMVIYQGNPSQILYSFLVTEKEYERMRRTSPKHGQHLFYPNIAKNTDTASVGKNEKQQEPSTTTQQGNIPVKQKGFTYRGKQSVLQQGQRPGGRYGSSWVQFGGESQTNKEKSSFNTQSADRPRLLNQRIFTPNKFTYPNQRRFQGGRYQNPYRRPFGTVPGTQGARWGNAGTQFSNDDRQFYTSDQGQASGGALPVFVWRTAGFTPCTSSCAGGIQSGVTRCIRSDTGETVLDIKCDPKLRPPERRRVCNLQPCPASWAPQEWKECSKTCGEGQQVRDLMCKQIIDRNGEKVTAMLPVVRCPVQLRPEVVRRCLLKPCPVLPKPKWVTGSWGTCSAECNYGLQKRVVTCKDYKNDTVNDSECKSKRKPPSLKSCYLGLCKAAWYSRTYWADCSKPCNSGIRNRPVICARVDGSALNEVYCRDKPKPKKTELCNGAACRGVWMTSEWSKCSADCGSGIQERTVICMKYISGRFQEINDNICSLDKKPVVKKRCSIKKCLPSWFTTKWTKCSVSCGKGTQTRHVSCLDSDGSKVGGCKAWERPTKHRRCHAAPCPGEERKAATQPSGSCIDQERYARVCNVVKQYNLCDRIPSYKRRCCKTCSTIP